jgi:hypothetical protein
LCASYESAESSTKTLAYPYIRDHSIASIMNALRGGTTLLVMIWTNTYFGSSRALPGLQGCS